MHRQMLVNQRELVVQLCHQTKQDYFKQKLHGVRDQKKLWSVANELLHRGKTRALPFHNSKAALAERFSGGRCLGWLRGYLGDRVQSVAVGDARS